MSKLSARPSRTWPPCSKEAESEKTMLLLDEADSFLQDRGALQRTYG